MIRRGAGGLRLDREHRTHRRTHARLP